MKRELESKRGRVRKGGREGGRDVRDMRGGGRESEGGMERELGSD